MFRVMMTEAGLFHLNSLKWDTAQAIHWYSNLLWSCKKVRLFLFQDLDVGSGELVPEGFVISRLTQKDTKGLMEFHNRYCPEFAFLFSKKEVARRLANGDRCYVGRKDGEIVGFNWFSPNRAYSPDLRCTFEVENRSLVLYNGYIRPDCRGKKFMVALLLTGFSDLRREGYEKCFAYMRSNNASALRVGEKMGGRVVGSLTYGSFLGYYFVIKRTRKCKELKVDREGSGWFQWKRFFHKRLAETTPFHTARR